MKTVLKIVGWVLRFVLFVLFALTTALLEGVGLVTKWLRDVSRPH